MLVKGATGCISQVWFQQQSNVTSTTKADPKKGSEAQVIMFNPWFDQCVSANIAKRFLCLIDRHFPKHHRYHRLVNWNTVKVSYSCMPNMAAIISSHTTKVLTPGSNPNTRTWSCRNKQQCPLGGNCLAKCIHYDDVIMIMLASQITSLTVVYSIVYSGVNQRKHQSSASLAFVREIHRGPVNFPHKWPVTRRMFPFDDVIMLYTRRLSLRLLS